MVERICGTCGGAWAKNFKFCPTDGSELVAVNPIVGKAAKLVAGKPSASAAVEVKEADRSASRKPSATRGFDVPDLVEPAQAPEVSTVLTGRKSFDAAAFVETACHPRPKRPSPRLPVTEPAPPAPEPSAQANPTQRRRFALRHGGDLVQ